MERVSLRWKVGDPSYAGIHWSFDCAAGEALGRKVGQYVAGHAFGPVTGSGGGALGAVAAAPVPADQSRSCTGSKTGGQDP